MKHEIVHELREGALDALRLYAALISAPFFISRAFVMRAPGEPFVWPPESDRARSAASDSTPN